MKNLISSLKLLATALLITFVSSCDDDDIFVDDGIENSAFDLTSNNPDFDSLNAALIKTGLNVTLDQSGTYTVFAPTDAAFEAFLTANNFATINEVPNSVLETVLLNHVLGTVNTSADLQTGYVKTLSTNADGDAYDLFVNTSSGIVLNGEVNVNTSMANIEVSNGVVHVIDQVIGIPTVATLAAANPNFSNLTTALTQENLVGALSNTSTTGAVPAPFTVFAPLNSSFQALIDADPNDNLNSIQDILALPNLDDILLYHVVSGAAVRAEDITNGLVVDPITNGTFTINTTGGVTITDGTGTVTNVVVTNVTGSNGVVHAIDFVLRP